MKRLVARWHNLWKWIFIAAVIGMQLLSLPLAVELAAMVVPLALAFVRPPRSTREPVEVAAPVRGRWVAINSPGSTVPSHGVRAYGQAYAIDVLHPSPPGTPNAVGWGLVARQPQEYSSFGQPVLAAADGRVVSAVSTQRDHRGRDTWPTLIFMMTVEAIVRDLAGARWLLGNHAVVEHADGTYGVYAHLRRDSLQLKAGDAVVRGQQLAEVGSTGNTSEPHLHFHLMDRARPTAAAGVPFRWTGVEMKPGELDSTRMSGSGSEPQRDRTAIDGLPANGQIFTAEPAPPAVGPGSTAGGQEQRAER